MPELDEGSTPDVNAPQNGPEGQQEGATEETVETTETTEAADDTDGDEDSLPAWARKRLTKANSEAAKYRTELRAAQDKLQNAKTLDEFNTAVGELTAKVEQLELADLKRDVLKKAELPEALAAKLNGKTREELEADAAFYKELGITTKASRKPPTNPGGGLTPEEPANTKVDPGAFAEKFFKNTKGYLL